MNHELRFHIPHLLRHSYPFDDIEHLQIGTNTKSLSEDEYKSTISFSVLDEMWLYCPGRAPEEM